MTATDAPANHTTTVRSTVISAPASAILPYLTDFTTWVDWSPWEKSGTKREYQGPQGEVGAFYGWDGDRKTGAGHMTVAKIAPTAVTIDLDFTRPFTTSSKVHFGLFETDGATKVVWTMYSPKNVMSRIMGLFMNFDKMIGGNFETGLAKLKALVEKG